MDAALLQHIDLLRLAMNIGGNKKTLHELLVLFASTTEESLTHMEEAAAKNNVLLWLQMAHKIKGAAKNITARRLEVLCLEAEEINSLPNPLSESVLYHMHKELAILREAIAVHFATK